MFPNIYSQNALISSKQKDIIWVCPPSSKGIEVVCVLAEPGHVCQVVLTISHGTDDVTSPVSFDLTLGRTLDDLHPVIEGANIPRCQYKTQLAFPIPGALDHEDLTRGGGVSWLYDFEEQEGHLDFLTRVVVLTFHAGSDGVPVTIGEVEILGRSLFWDNICRRVEFDPYFEGSSPETVAQHISLATSSHGLQTGVHTQSTPSTSHHLDLLSGMFEPEVKQVTEFKNTNPFLTDDDYANIATNDMLSWDPFTPPTSESMITHRLEEEFLGQKTQMKSLRPAAADIEAMSAPAAADYIEIVKSIMNAARSITFDEAMELEIQRLKLGLSAAQRDYALKNSLGLDPARLDPNKLLNPSYVFQVRHAAFQLALATQSMAEDEEYAVVGQDLADVDSTGPSGNFSIPSKEAVILCKRCEPTLAAHAVLLDRVKLLTSRRRRTRVQSAATEALKELTKLGFGSVDTTPKIQKDIESLLRGQSSLAEYPYATLLTSIETAAGSDTAQSLLAPWNSRTCNSFWRAPIGVSTVDFCVLLATPSTVTSIVLLVSSCGYNSQDVPIVDISYGDMVDAERKYLGRWDIAQAAEAAGTQHIYRPNDGSTPCPISYQLASPVRCRLVYLKFTLRAPSTQAVPDLLFFDETPSSSSSHGGPSFLHAKRILVLGKPYLDEENFNLDASMERISLKNMLEAPTRFSRLRVQTEMERALDGGRRIEQVVTPLTPSVAGFRFDAPGAIRYAAKYTVSAFNEPQTTDVALACCLDESHISPATLRIRVTFERDIGAQPEYIGEFMLPIARPGTPLYFDFDGLVTARSLTFELVGDISAFHDEGADYVESESKDSALASSLSLVNRVRIYRYVRTVELGKWPLLNAV
jgi:hypothetical protein